jgi:RNA polymerase sigma-70 factor (ECF subfamily)
MASARQAGPAEIGEGVAQRAVVLAALATLGENDREALRLIAWDGLTSKAAAEVLGVTKIAFGVRLHRARRRFSAALAAAERAGQASPPPAGCSDRELTASGRHGQFSLAAPREVR